MMKKIKPLSLTQLNKVGLEESRMSRILGGDDSDPCSCACWGPSSTTDNHNANHAYGYGSSGNGNGYCACRCVGYVEFYSIRDLTKF